MNTLLSIACLVLVSGCARTSASSSESPASIPEGWIQGNSLDFDGRKRTYALYAPADGDPRGLMVVLHGSGDSVNQMILAIEVESIADENGLLVAVPAGVDGGWNDEDPPGGEHADDVGFVDSLVTEIKTAYPDLPSERVFAHGFSNGGGLATRLACESSQVRGVGVIGNYYMTLFDGCPRPVGHPVPGWFGAGVDDGLVRVESVREGMASYVADLTDCPTGGSFQPVEADDVPDGVVCKQAPDCDLARLCEYDDRGHEVLPGSVLAAWNFLSAAVEPSAN